MNHKYNINDHITIQKSSLQQLINNLKRAGYQVVGPTIREQAIVYDEINSMEDLPKGFTDEQNPAAYRLKKRNDNAYFGYVVGPHSWKKYLHPPNVKLTSIHRNGKELEVVPHDEKPAQYAFLGVRSCELSAIAIQDKVFMGGPYVDSIYKSRRDGAFLIAVNCVEAKGTCFCVSMNTGPKAKKGYDLSITEILNDKQHLFMIHMGSERGAEMMTGINGEKVNAQDLKAEENGIHNAVQQMGRKMETKNIQKILADNFEHPRWEDVAKRCLTCANCTMVCPTCFCSTVEDVTDLTGDNAERWRKWDSCFTMDFSYVAGGSVRSTTKARYRQWMTHKLSTWIDQFNESGCVGCGRCITWCPVGIDITEELAAIRKKPVSKKPKENLS